MSDTEVQSLRILGEKQQAYFEQDHHRACSEAGLFQGVLHESNLLDTCQPIFPLCPPHLTPWATAFMRSNVFGQSTLMLTCIGHERQRLQLLQASIQDQLGFLEEKEVEFLSEVKYLANAEQNMQMLYKTCKAKEATVQGMRRRVDAANTDSEMCVFMEHMKRKRNSTGVSIAPSLAFPGLPSITTQSTGPLGTQLFKRATIDSPSMMQGRFASVIPRPTAGGEGS